MRCSSSIVVPALSEAMVLDPQIAREVLLSIRRLVGISLFYYFILFFNIFLGKFGKSLQQLTWTCVLQLLERAVKYVKIVGNILILTFNFENCFQKQLMQSNEVYIELLQIIKIIENFYLQNEYCGSVDAFFAVVELCCDALPDETVFRLIDYRVSVLFLLYFYDIFLL